MIRERKFQCWKFQVSAHHQNGIANEGIQDLTKRAHEMLLHTKSRWRSAVNTAIWMYAFRKAQEIENAVPAYKKGESRLETYTRCSVASQLRHFHTFRSHIFALNAQFQVGHKLPQWITRVRLGINLGCSPIHTRYSTHCPAACHINFMRCTMISLKPFVATYLTKM